MLNTIRWYIVKKTLMLGIPYLVCSILGISLIGYGSTMVDNVKADIEEQTANYGVGILLIVGGLILLIIICALFCICLKWRHHRVQQSLNVEMQDTPPQ